MNIPSEEATTIKTDIHCPYCGGDHGVLISRITEKNYSFQMPAYGLKWVLSVLYLSIYYILVYGYKLFEIKKELRNQTYVFCPECGKSYSMTPSEEVKKVENPPKYKRNINRRVVSGLCAGVADYTGISLGWIRFMTALYWCTGIGFIIYFAVAACTPYNDNPPQKLFRNKKKKILTGLCAGISEFTQISLGWIRFIVIANALVFLAAVGAYLFNTIEEWPIFAIIMCVIVAIGFVIYYLISSCVPFKEEESR